MRAAVSTWLALATAVLASPPASSAGGSEDALEWLERMNQAAESLSYEGTFVYLHGTQLEAMRIVHTVDGHHERERLTSLNGEPREVVRDNETVTCISPHTNSVSVDERRGRFGVPNLRPSRLNELRDYYVFELHPGRERIAGRPARVVSIVPRDGYRYGYRLYLDEDHALPVKTDMLDEAHRAVAQIMFTDLRVDPDLAYDASALEIDAETLAGHSTGRSFVRPGRHDPDRWQFGDLPPGFRLSVQDVRLDSETGSRLEHFVLTDGLASVSVYIEPSEAVRGFQGPSGMGALNAYGQRIGDHQVTVVGEVPERMVKTVAEGIRFSGERAAP
jgi:sigma-E factor negative regulatory protein RseB